MFFWNIAMLGINLKPSLPRYRTITLVTDSGIFVTTLRAPKHSPMCYCCYWGRMINVPMHPFLRYRCSWYYSHTTNAGAILITIRASCAPQCRPTRVWVIWHIAANAMQICYLHTRFCILTGCLSIVCRDYGNVLYIRCWGKWSTTFYDFQELRTPLRWNLQKLRIHNLYILFWLKMIDFQLLIHFHRFNSILHKLSGTQRFYQCPVQIRII